jgi:hypothetical protein
VHPTDFLCAPSDVNNLHANGTALHVQLVEHKKSLRVQAFFS